MAPADRPSDPRPTEPCPSDPRPTEEARAAAALLAGLPAMTPRRLVALLDGFDPVVALQAVRAGVHPADPGLRFRAPAGRGDPDRDPAAVLTAYRRAGVTVLLRDDPAYPARLVGDAGAPAVLFARGDPGALELRPAVALVGTRSATPYGLQMASELAAGLVDAGVAVVSGLARGIDGAAHAGATAALRRAAGDDRTGEPSRGAAGVPVAVVGTGVDVVYPREHAALWREVTARGVLFSEAPLGSPARRGAFPARNRIIAALADVVVVVECHREGGSWHTIDAASRRSIPVGAVPGSVKSAASAGTNQLLVDGCAPVRDVDDVLAAVELARAGVAGPSRHPRRASGGAGGRVRDHRPTHGSAGGSAGPRFPSPAHEAVWRTVEDHPTPFETVVLRTGLSVAATARAGDELVAAGWLTPGAGWWSRRSPA